MKKLLLAIFLISFILSCTKDISGTNDETVIRSGAIIYEPDGKTPSVGATVKVFKENAIDGQYISKQTTDTNGTYTLQGLPKGSYNIWAEKDSLVTFQSSVFVSDSQTSLHNDTLKCPSSLTGIVGIQPQHDPRSVTIQVVGTDKYFNNTDVAGRFIMKGMAAGKYSLLLKSTLTDYTPTTIDIVVQACSNDTLVDTLWLIYTGIPVVTGIVSSYDTVNGTVHLQWNKTAYRNFQEYAIYRDCYDSINLSVSPVAVSSDTFFVDTIFKDSISSGKYSKTDPNDYHFKYRIAIRNNSGKYGETYKYVNIVAASPTKVKSVFFFTTYHLLKGVFIDSASINDTMRLTTKIDNPTRKLRNVSWSDLGSGAIVRSSILDTTSMTATDTCRCTWDTTGTKGIVCSVKDMAGSLWCDTLLISIVQDSPIVLLSTLTPVVGTMDTIKLHVSASDRFGHISKIEWDIGNKGTFIENTVFDTAFMVPDNSSENLLCIVRVTDDDGNSINDSVAIHMNQPPCFVDSFSLLDDTIFVQDTIISTIQVNDPEGDTISFHLITTASCLMISGNKLICTPQESDTGDYNAILICTDSKGLSDSIEFDFQIRYGFGNVSFYISTGLSGAVDSISISLSKAGIEKYHIKVPSCGSVFQYLIQDIQTGIWDIQLTKGMFCNHMCDPSPCPNPSAIWDKTVSIKNGKTSIGF